VAESGGPGGGRKGESGEEAEGREGKGAGEAAVRTYTRVILFPAQAFSTPRRGNSRSDREIATEDPPAILYLSSLKERERERERERKMEGKNDRG